MIQDSIKISIFLLLLCNVGQSQQNGVRDSLFVDLDENREFPVFLHSLQKKQTLFTLAQMYQTELNQIFSLNPKLSTKIKEGQLIRVPYQADLIHYDNAANYRAVYLRCRFDDRIFHIINRELDLSWRKIKKLNPDIEDKSTFPSIILLGYVDLAKPMIQNESIAEQQIKSTNETKSKEPEKSSTDKRATDLQLEKTNNVNPVENNIEAFHFSNAKRGLAYCDKKFNDNGRYYALHSKARINSIVELSNPVTGRKVFAKVVGRIPKVYPMDAEIIVTREVARELGCLDSRFFIEVKYE